MRNLMQLDMSRDYYMETGNFAKGINQKLSKALFFSSMLRK